MPFSYPPFELNLVRVVENLIPVNERRRRLVELVGELAVVAHAVAGVRMQARWAEELLL